MNPVLILQFIDNDAPAYLGTWLAQRGITSDLRLATADRRLSRIGSTATRRSHCWAAA